MVNGGWWVDYPWLGLIRGSRSIRGLDYPFSSFSEKDGMVLGCRLFFLKKGS